MKSHPFMWSCNLIILPHSLKMSLGLLKVFAFCGMVISVMFILLTLLPFLILFFDITFAFGSYHICPFTNYFLKTFSLTTLIPCYISAVTQSIFSFFKNHFSVKAKNILFFVCVLQMLLVLSGTVEYNPGHHMSKHNFSFAVWNLDSLPARDFARIPLIESLQASYDFDMFGVC